MRSMRYPIVNATKIGKALKPTVVPNVNANVKVSPKSGSIHVSDDVKANANALELTKDFDVPSQIATRKGISHLHSNTTYPIFSTWKRSFSWLLTSHKPHPIQLYGCNHTLSAYICGYGCTSVAVNRKPPGNCTPQGLGFPRKWQTPPGNRKDPYIRVRYLEHHALMLATFIVEYFMSSKACEFESY